MLKSVNQCSVDLRNFRSQGDKYTENVM